MLRKSARTTVPEESAEPPKKNMTHEEIMEERLDLILDYLHRAERRDRWRTVAGFIRNFILILPFLAFLGSLWFVYVHGDDLIDAVSQRMARQSAAYTQGNFDKAIEGLRGYLRGSGSSSSAAAR